MVLRVPTGRVDAIRLLGFVVGFTSLKPNSCPNSCSTTVSKSILLAAALPGVAWRPFAPVVVKSAFDVSVFAEKAVDKNELPNGPTDWIDSLFWSIAEVV